MASEETDVQHPGVDRFSLDDFRLRLDSPLFHRDPGLPSGPVSRELPWERSTTPSQPEPAHTESPLTDMSEFSAKLLQASALPSMPRLPTFSEIIAAPAEPMAVAEAAIAGPQVALVDDEPEAPAPTQEFGTAALSVLRAGPHATPPRHSDTFVNDLAEMIMHATAGPATVEPAAPDATTPAPVAEVAPASVEVQAELNRLAFLPDREESPERVAVPAIMVSDPVPVVAAAPPEVVIPNLSQHEMYLPRMPVQPPARRSYADFAASLAPAARRRKRHPIRKLFATVVLLGLVGGGLFAAKYYFFDQRWDAEVKPMVAEVETARGLAFDHAVEVTTLPGSEYAAKVVKSTFGIDDENAATFAGGWRALGLLSGGLDPSGLGLAGLADSPAFYEPASETIYVVADLPENLHRFALQRALTLALLDQEYGWSGRVSGQSSSVARGTRALYDADALAVATSLLTDTERSAVLLEQSALYTAFPVGASAAPYVTTLATRSGLALRAYFDGTAVEARDAVERDAMVNDGAALDLRMLVAPQPLAQSAQSEGMLFWYHALAARVGNDTAWRAALGWRDDSVTFVRGDRTCVTALVRIDPASYDIAVSAFQAWAAAGPVEAGTQVTTTDATTGQISISACDPGDSVATNDGRVRLTLGGAPLRSEQFHRLVATYPQLPATQLACAVFSGDGVSPGDERGVIDPVGGWAAPMAHPAPDPNQPGCSQP